MFVAMATVVGLTQISVAQLNSPTPLAPYRNVGRISHTSRAIANFLLKFSNFRCHGNRGWSGTNFTSTVKVGDPDNPLSVSRNWGRISHTSRVIANFLLNSRSWDIKFLKNGVWYGKSYYRQLIGNHLLIDATFDDLEVHLKVIST